MTWRAIFLGLLQSVLLITASIMEAFYLGVSVWGACCVWMVWEVRRKLWGSGDE